ncbi:TRAP transporter small permease [Roseitranquillus sediminis]|uniref:TRAP transporter small permease n=1 Tax=Roseitranquillus sediminis TaxID=2809051 RepID=UPI001D0C7E4E|nr:TRAP transporter small permease subunit [Roseitranquillus sediminis]MBM9593546.1 TRAP transporter small permease subunit [Roseitranquillus sediminis]
MTRDPDDEDLGRQIEEASRAADFLEYDQGLGRFDRTINLIAELAGVAIFATILGLVFFNAVGRYALGFTFIWGDEIVLSLLPWLGMTGMFLAIRRRQVIRIEFFASLLPRPVYRVLTITASVFAAAVFLWLAFVSMRYVGLFGGDRLIYLPIDKVWFMSAMVIGPAIAAVAYLIVAVQDAVGHGSGGR